MNNQVAIRVDKLSKKFILQYPITGSNGAQTHELWALKDISFDLKKGESIGIIGPNGSGKSTLLKILSGITSPTLGSVEIHGRVAAILDVGTGFHPDLSGRENIYLSGTLIGMTKEEINSRYNQIVEFSGIGNFIETPVKFYSSGMYIRLAFSIIAFLEADIMIFDEVIAVGDADFNMQCKKKIEELIRAGKTLIIASHNMNELFNYCTHTIRFDKGKISSEGDTGSEVSHYLEEVYNKQQALKNQNISLNESGLFPATQVLENVEQIPENDSIRLNSIHIFSKEETNKAVFFNDEAVSVEMDYTILKENFAEKFGMAIRTIDGSPIFATDSEFNRTDDKKTGRYKATCVIAADLLNAGIFNIAINCIWEDKFFKFPVQLSFKIKMRNSDENQNLQFFFGPVKPKLRWVFERIN
jgi:lipopolysaccharide transport system ATP-binding protein